MAKMKISQKHEDVLADVIGAAKMLSQALNRISPTSDLAKELKKVDESLDEIRYSLDHGDFDA